MDPIDVVDGVLKGNKKSFVIILILFMISGFYTYKVVDDVETLKTKVESIETNKASKEYVDQKFNILVGKIDDNKTILNKIDNRLYDLTKEKGNK